MSCHYRNKKSKLRHVLRHKPQTGLVNVQFISPQGLANVYAILKNRGMKYKTCRWPYISSSNIDCGRPPQLDSPSPAPGELGSIIFADSFILLSNWIQIKDFITLTFDRTLETESLPKDHEIHSFRLCITLHSVFLSDVQN